MLENLSLLPTVDGDNLYNCYLHFVPFGYEAHLTQLKKQKYQTQLFTKAETKCQLKEGGEPCVTIL